MHVTVAATQIKGSWDRGSSLARADPIAKLHEPLLCFQG